MKVSNDFSGALPPAAFAAAREAGQADFAAALARASREDDQRLMAACRDLEALFLKQVLSRMRATVGSSGLFSGGQAEEIFRDLLDDSLSKEMAAGGGIGLAEQIYAQYQKVDKLR